MERLGLGVLLAVVGVAFLQPRLWRRPMAEEARMWLPASLRPSRRYVGSSYVLFGVACLILAVGVLAGFFMPA